MLEIIRENKKKFCLLFLGLMIPIYILSVIYSEGFGFDDEHYQILEFAKYKLGEQEASKLAWEFPAKMRPAIQPFIAYGVIKFARFCLLSDETAILFLRLLSGILGLFCYLLLLNQNFPKIKNKRFAYLSLIFCLTIWFLPYCQVRFSSENWSGIFFWLAFYLFFQDKQPSFKLIIAGIFLGLSFQFRYQMGFCIIGLFLWLWIVHDRFKITKLIILPFLSMSMIIVLITYYIDSWLYGEFIIPAYNYFYQNLILGASAKLTNSNNDTWVFYFLKGAESFILPFGIVFLVAIVSFFYLKPKHPFTWVILPFCIVHLIVSNKQLRFMYPLIYVLPVMIIFTFQILSEDHTNKFKRIVHHKWLRVSLTIYFVINTIIMFNRAIYPAMPDVINMNFLNNDLKQRFKNQTAHLISVYPNGLYRDKNLFKNIYKPKNLIEIYLPPKKIDLHIKKQIQKFQEKKVNSFYLNILHTRFYQGLPPFPKALQIIKKKCNYLFNMLDIKRIKYNIYRVIRQAGTLKSIYFCKT